MNRNRIIQLVLLLVLFVAGVIIFSGSQSTGPESVNSSEYLPPNP